MNRLFQNTNFNFIIFFLSFWSALISSSGYAFNDLLNDEISGHEIQPKKAFILVGEGTMSWLWFDIYQAKLLTPTGNYKARQWPLSLELIYARNISSADLLQTTEEEWQRQAITYKKQWLMQLNKIWPNVTSEDKLILYVNKMGQSHFFYNEQYIGGLSDENFAHAFTAIWLSENTLNPELRSQLTGLTQ